MVASVTAFRAAVLMLCLTVVVVVGRGIAVFDPQSMDGELPRCVGSKQCGSDRVCLVDPVDDGQRVCLHEQLFPLSTRDVFGSLALLCGLFLAACAGIGGGGLAVPILLLVFGFEMVEAVVLSTAAVLGNALSQLAVNVRQRHPRDPRKTLIDFEAILLVLPSQVAGGHLGVILGGVFPTTILYLLSIALLSAASFKTLKKARSLHKRENKVVVAVEEQEEETVLLPLIKLIPWAKVGVVVFFVAAFAVDYVFLKRQRPCSLTYWAWLLPLYPFVGLTVYMTSSRKQAPADYEELPSDADLELDVDWSKQGLVVPSIALAIGCVSSLLGIGGGELLGPFLLAMKMPPRRSSATTATCTFLSTSATMVHYALSSDLQPREMGWYAAWLFALGLGAGLAGRKTALRLANLGKVSLIAFALGVVLLISASLMVYDAVTTKPDFKFNSPCAR